MILWWCNYLDVFSIYYTCRLSKALLCFKAMNDALQVSTHWKFDAFFCNIEKHFKFHIQYCIHYFFPISKRCVMIQYPDLMGSHDNLFLHRYWLRQAIVLMDQTWQNVLNIFQCIGTTLLVTQWSPPWLNHGTSVYTCLLFIYQWRLWLFGRLGFAWKAAQLELGQGFINT